MTRPLFRGMQKAVWQKVADAIVVTTGWDDAVTESAH
jgi:hypothetical protein